MADNRIEIDIVLDDGSISKGILKAESVAKRSGENIGNSLEGSIRRGSSRGLDSIGGKIRSIAGIFAAAFAGREIIRAFQSVTNEAAEFENQLVAVRTLLDSDSFGGKNLEEGFDSLRKGALDVFKGLPVQIEEVNKALFDTVSAGVSAGKAIDVVRTAGELATAGITDISVATDGITTALNAFSINASEAESVAAKFFTAQKLGKTTIEELSSSIGTAASTAAAAGVSFDELLASVSAATTGGIATSSAFAGIRAIISNIAKPSKEAADTAKRLGVEFNLAALESKGLAGFLNDVRRSANGSTQDLKNLFGSAEAFNVAASLTGNQSEAFSNALKEISNGAKSAATFTEALGNTLKDQAVQNQIYENRLKAIRIELGTLLLPFRNLIQNGVLRLAESFRDSLPDIVAVGGAIVQAVIIPFRTLTGIIEILVSGFIALFTSVRTAGVGIRKVVVDFMISPMLKAVEAGASLAGFFNKDLGDSLRNAASGIRGSISTATDREFQEAKRVSDAAVELLGENIKNTLSVKGSEAVDEFVNKTIAGLQTASAAASTLASSGVPGGTGQPEELGGGTPGLDVDETKFDLMKEQQETLRNFVIANQDLLLSNRELVEEVAGSFNVSTEAIDTTLTSGQASLKNFQDRLGGLKESVKKNSLDISNVINQTLARGISGGVAVMTNALLNGQDAFKAFGEFTIGLLGDFMIRVGEMAIQVGIAALGVKAALESLNPAVAIAAGAVLIALGTAFKNLSSGPSATSGGGGGSIPAATSGGGGVSGGQIGNIGEDSQLSLGEQQTGRQANIEVNIQGNVLDRRETALEIIEVLEEASFAGIEVAV